MERRKFIDLFLIGSGLGTFISLLYPVFRYLMPTPRKEESVSQVVAAKIGDLAPNSAKLFRFGAEPALLIFTEEGNYLAYSAICTHLTCTVGYDSSTETLLCPCHNGRFNLNGEVISGPPPRPLTRLNLQIRGEEIVVWRERG